MNAWCILMTREWIQMKLKSWVRWKVKRWGQILGYDSKLFLFQHVVNLMIFIWAQMEGFLLNDLMINKTLEPFLMLRINKSCIIDGRRSIIVYIWWWCLRSASKTEKIRRKRWSYRERFQSEGQFIWGKLRNDRKMA